MSTWDEITKEKQRVSEALARVDAQREKLSSQLDELEATERVLARYSKVTPANRTASTKTLTAATKVSAITRALTHYDHKTNWRQAHLIGHLVSLPVVSLPSQRLC